MSKQLVFINTLITLTLHDGNHLEFPVPKPEFFKGPKAMATVLPAGTFEVPLAAEEGKDQTILKGTAPEIVIALTKGFNPETVGKDGKLDGAKYSTQLAKLQSILAGKATKDEAETGIVLNNAALITTIERALNPALDEQITAVEEASEEDANPYTIAIVVITDFLLAEETPSPEAAPEEVKAEAENAPEPVAETTPTATKETPAANLPEQIQNQSGGVVIYPENVLTATKAVLAGAAKRRAAQKNILAALQDLNTAEEADEIALSALTGSVLATTTETVSK